MATKNLKMEGIPQETKSLIDETMNVCEAILEFGDNAIDGKATMFSISLDENKCLTMKDNGEGIEDLEKYAKKFRVDKKDESGKIGHFRKGSKYGAIKLSDFNEYSSVQITTNNGKKAQKLHWPFEPNMRTFENVFITDDDYNEERGTTVKITKSVVVKDNLSAFKRMVKRTYAYKIKFENFKVSVKSPNDGNETIVEGVENLFLENLIGEHAEHKERLHTPGVYYHETTNENGKTYVDIFYLVRVNKVKDITNNKYYEIPFVLAFICDNTKFKVSDKDAAHTPFDIMYNEKYLSNDHTYVSMHFKNLNRGGAWRIRPLLILDENTLEVFGGISNKSKPIPSISFNKDLKNLEIVVNKGVKDTIKNFYTVTDSKRGTSRPKNIVEVLESQYKWLVAFNNWRSTNFPNQENFECNEEAKKYLESKILTCEEHNYYWGGEEKTLSFVENDNYSVLSDDVKRVVNYIADALKQNKVKERVINASISDAIDKYTKLLTDVDVDVA